MESGRENLVQTVRAKKGTKLSKVHLVFSIAE